VAVIQISRIQQRRGQKHATGIPQLSSAELAWAVDTQELFIGNGSVAEGAPYVGNTRILTEHSNIFQDAVYQFIPDVMDSVPRKAQSKLDEYVSILDFVEKDINGVISWANTFERAFFNLFASTDHNYRKVLTIPNGTYEFERDVYLRSGVILRGESRDNVILNFGTHCLVTGSATDVKLQNFTMSGSLMLLDITGLSNSSISDITFIGTYLNTNTDPNIFHTPAVWWNNASISSKVDNVEFLNCKFDTTNTSVLVTQTTAFETNIKFDSCIFSNCYRGIAINGVVGQSNRWVVKNCSFTDVYDSAIIVSRGKNMVVRDSTFYRCGNGVGTPDSPLYIVILFGDVDNNLVIDCSCDRRRAVGLNVSISSDAVSDAENCNLATFVDYIPVDIIAGNTNAIAFTNFNSTTDFVTIDYSLTMGHYLRHGQLQVLIGDLAFDNSLLAVYDNYTHSTPAYNLSGPDFTQQFQFSADSSPNLSSVVLKYTNGSGHAGSLVYKVTYGSAQVSIIPMQFGATPGNHQILVNWNPNASPSGAPVTGFSLSVSN
jgi:hypothetical protein